MGHKTSKQAQGAAVGRQQLLKQEQGPNALHAARESLLDIIAPPVHRIPIYYKDDGVLDTARYTRDELRQVAWQLQHPNQKRNGLMDTQGMVYSFV